MMKTVVMTAVLALGFAVGVSAQDAKKIAVGKAAYEKHGCVKCHQIDGKGSKISPLDGVGTKLTEAEIRQWLVDPDAMTAKLPKKPTARMKKQTLTDAEVDGLVAYLASLKKK
jgi:mono/diheme cytochrome c family protein